MRIKLFTFRYSATLGGFDDSPLIEFTRDKEVLGFREHFFSVNDTPHLACVLTWQDAVVGERDLARARAAGEGPAPDPTRAPIPPGAARKKPRRGRRDAPDATAGLDERQRALFNTLREWRAQKAREEGVPAYLVFTNRHLLAMVTDRPDSPTALGHLHGVGPGKVKRYAEEVLAVMNGDGPGSAAQEEPEANEQPDPGEEDAA